MSECQCKTCRTDREQKAEIDRLRSRSEKAELALETEITARIAAEKRLELLESFIRRFARVEEHGEESAMWCVVVHDDMMPTPVVYGPEDDVIKAMVAQEEALRGREGK